MKAKLGLRPPTTAKVQRQTVSSALARKPAAGPALRIIDGGLDGGALLRLQASAGNQAVGALIKGPRLSIQSLSLGTLLRPAETVAAGVGEEASRRANQADGAVASAAAVVGEAVAIAPKPAEVEGSPAVEVGEKGAVGPKAGDKVAAGETGATGPKVGDEAAAVTAGVGEGAASSTAKGTEPGAAPKVAADAGAAAAGKAPAVAAAPVKAPASGAAAGGGGAPGAGAAPALETESAPTAAVETAGEAGAAASRPTNPRDDPRFAAVAGRVGGVATKQKSHPPARTKVAESENAAKGPGNEAASGDIKASTTAPPNTAGIAPKPVTPMQPEAPGPRPPDLKAGDAMPAAKPEAQVALDHTKPETDKQL